MQSGFLLVTAIFLLVILAALGAFILTISGTQQTSSALDVQGSRAYQAARAGIEWASDQLLISAGTGGAVAFVQSKSAAASPFSGTATMIAVTFTNPVVAGNLIAGYVTYDGNGTLNSVTDSLGNTYTIVQTLNDAVSVQKSSTFYAKNILGGADTVTATFSPAICCRVIIVHEISGADKVAPLDANAGQLQATPGTGANAVTSGNMTTTGNLDYIFGGTSDSAGVVNQTISAGTGETSRINLTFAAIGGNATASEDQIQATAGAVASTFTFNVAGGASLTLEMAFKAPTSSAFATACTPGPTTQNVTGMGGTLSGFTATVQCSSTTTTEGGATVTVYQIISTGAQGTVGTLDRVERQLQVTLSK